MKKQTIEKIDIDNLPFKGFLGGGLTMERLEKQKNKKQRENVEMLAKKMNEIIDFINNK